MRTLLLVALVLGIAAPAAAQDPTESSSARVQPTAAPRPLGVYNGVEPGEAQPPPAYGRVVRRQRGRRQGLILTWPGFAPLGDGSSRFFIQTTEPMAPELLVEEGRVVVLFRNTTLHLRNSGRWLETRFFNTPILRARLERRRRDMALVLILRPNTVATPRIASEAAQGGNFHYTYIDFPPGDYAPVVAETPPRASTVPNPTGRPGQPPAAPARPLDPSIQAMDDERPPGM
ncbi:MAG: hypothetical protein H6719_01945 [Sandaracinaceae bacterium]|nr:hypothetical protein [Sandaracinaceae bacterium]